MKYTLTMSIVCWFEIWLFEICFYWFEWISWSLSYSEHSIWVPKICLIEIRLFNVLTPFFISVLCLFEIFLVLEWGFWSVFSAVGKELCRVSGKWW